MADYPRFGSIPRWYKDFVITEKVDGTNALIHIDESLTIRAGSRSRWITPNDDNYGFAQWVLDHDEELTGLGPGYHYGEWYGKGIQRKYGLDRRCFALFNTYRWNYENLPECCDVVPIIWQGSGDILNGSITFALDELREHGSVIVPGFMNPEGIVIYSTETNSYWKKTIRDDRAGMKVRNEQRRYNREFNNA